MNTLIPLSHFYEKSVFEQEKLYLFSRAWLFVGLSDRLLEPDSYITLDFFGEPVVIKNFNGKLKAFLNVCSHRFSKICLNKSGSGPLQCPYHGWTYNEDGIPYAIPRKKTFSLLDVASLKLKEFQVEKIGRLLFLKKESGGVNLHDYLGEMAGSLEQISDALGSCLDTNELEINANWKIVVENTLEEYHVRQVHPNSLYKVDIQSSDFKFSGLHSSDHMTFSRKLHDFKKLCQLVESRKWHVKDYEHQLIFPTMTLASSFGTTIAVQQIIPLSEEKTRFISYVFSARLDKNEDHSLVRAFNESAVAFNRQVFQEDSDICESVQIGIKHAITNSSCLSMAEERIHAFENNYMTFMKE